MMQTSLFYQTTITSPWSEKVAFLFNSSKAEFYFLSHFLMGKNCYGQILNSSNTVKQDRGKGRKEEEQRGREGEKK